MLAFACLALNPPFSFALGPLVGRGITDSGVPFTRLGAVSADGVFSVYAEGFKDSVGFKFGDKTIQRRDTESLYQAVVGEVALTKQLAEGVALTCNLRGGARSLRATLHNLPGDHGSTRVETHFVEGGLILLPPIAVRDDRKPEDRPKGPPDGPWTGWFLLCGTYTAFGVGFYEWGAILPYFLDGISYALHYDIVPQRMKISLLLQVVALPPLQDKLHGEELRYDRTHVISPMIQLSYNF